MEIAFPSSSKQLPNRSEQFRAVPKPSRAVPSSFRAVPSSSDRSDQFPNNSDTFPSRSDPFPNNSEPPRAVPNNLSVPFLFASISIRFVSSGVAQWLRGWLLIIRLWVRTLLMPNKICWGRLLKWDDVERGFLWKNTWK